MALRRKEQSLAEKISNLVTAAPTVFGSDDENEETKAKVVDPYDEIESDDEPVGSTFRKRNVNHLDEIGNRYKGKKVSRKDVYEMNNESEESDTDNEETENLKDLDSVDENSEGEKSVENEEINSDVEDEEIGSDDDDEEIGSDDDDEEIGSDDNDEEMSSGSENKKFGSDGDDQDIGSDAQDEDDSDTEESNSDMEEDSEIDESNPLRRNRKGEINFEHVTSTNVRADVEKGNCVREQLKIWENLLEVRIKLQKCLITGNQMPQQNLYQKMKVDERFKKDADDAKNKLGGLLENLLELQTNLLKNYPETKNLLGQDKKRKAIEKVENEESDEEICSDTEDEMGNDEENANEGSTQEGEDPPPTKKKKLNLIEHENLIAKNHEIYREYRNTVIQKWNDKTRVASGSVNKSSSQAIVKQIDFILNDKEKLLKRTRLKRSEYDIVGKEGSSQDEDGRRLQEHDTEIYDDDDFYHQLLRELIEYKSSDITDPVQLSKQWIALQNMRRKMKRKIDTRATKGRRIRYNVHTKLVNFMAPINVNDAWSDLAKNELYNSLFGKIKSTEINSIENEESCDK